MSNSKTITERIGELGALAAIVYVISFSYGYLHIRSLYKEIGLYWYVPYLPTSYFSMSSALLMASMILMTTIYYICLSFEHSDFTRTLAIATAILMTIYLSGATAYIYLTDWQDIHSAISLADSIEFMASLYFPLCIILCSVASKQVFKYPIAKMLIPAAVVMLAYTVPRYAGKAEALDMMTSYGRNLPSVLDKDDKKEWRILHINEDKALVVNFPMKARSHTEAKIMEISDLDLHFPSPGFIGVLGAASEVVEMNKGKEDHSK